MRKRIVWHLEVPKHLNKQLEDYLANPKSQFKTKSEFIRTAVRDRLKEENKRLEAERKKAE